MVAASATSYALPPAAVLLNVTSYGAVGNGITDDTAAIQAAALAAAASGKQLYFPAGTYVVSQALRMPSNTTWLAVPGTATLITTNGNPLVTVVQAQNDTINGLGFAGSTTAANPSALVIGYQAQGLRLINATVRDTSGIGVLLSDVNDTTVVNADFSNIGNSPAGLTQDAQGVAFTNDAAGFGSGNSVVGSTFFGMGLDAISATGQSGFQAVSNTVTNGPINPGWGQLPAAPAGIYGNQDSDLVVADNSIQGASGNGIDIANSSTVAVYQNTVTGNGGAGIGVYSDRFATVSWNTALNNNVMGYYQTPGGIVVGAMDASNIVIAHNVSGNQAAAATQMFGIQVLDSQDATSGTLTIAQDNVLTGNLAAAIASPQGSYAWLADSDLPAMAYPAVVNDAPILSLAPAGVATTGTASVQPFAAATIAAADMGVTEALTVTVAGGDAAGTLSGVGVVGTSTPGTYTVGSAGSTPAAATAALQGAVFTPAASGQPPGTVLNTTLSVVDVQTSPTSGTPVSSSATTTVSVTAVAAPISATPAAASVATTDEATVAPFSAVLISDPNPAQTETAVVTLGSLAGGSLSSGPAGPFGGSFNNGTYTVSGTAVAVAAALDGLVFTPTPHQVAPGQTVATTIQATITDTAGQQTAISSTVAATAVNDAPTITTPAGGTTSDETPIDPLAGLTISDPDVDATEAVTVLLLNASLTATDADGTLSGAGLTQTAPGTYTLAGSPAAVARALDALVFTPTPHQVAPGQTVSTAITVIVGQNGAYAGAFGWIGVNAVNDAPAIGGIEAALVSAPGAASQPFATATVTDADAGAAVSLTITLTDATGAASDADGLLSGAGLIKTGTGSYLLDAATPSVLSGELQGLTFTPAASDGQAVGTTFTLTACQTAGGTTTATTATLGVRVSASNTIDGPAAGSAVLVGNTGADTILAAGSGNTIDSNGGSDIINAGQGNATVNAGDGNQTIDLGGGANTVTGGNGNDIIVGAPDGATSIQLGSGNDIIALGGGGNTVQLGDGNDLVVSGQGGAFVATGAGDSTIMLGGSGNTVVAGSGTTAIIDGTGNDTVIVPRAGQGLVLWFAFTGTNGDVLNLRPALQAAGWDQQDSTLGNYVSLTDNGPSATLSIAAAPVVQLYGASGLTLAGLLSNHVLYTGA